MSTTQQLILIYNITVLKNKTKISTIVAKLFALRRDKHGVKGGGGGGSVSVAKSAT